MTTPLRPFRIPSKLDRLKMAVAYARAMKTLREAVKPEDTSAPEKAEGPQKLKAAKKR